MSVSDSDETTTPLISPSQEYSEAGNDDSDPALSSSLRLYDPCSTLEIAREVADGFLILLSGGMVNASIAGKKGHKRRKSKKSNTGGESSSQTQSDDEDVDESSISLAFLALTDGNVVDACFGVHPNGGLGRSRDTSPRAYNASRAVKEALSDAADSSDAVRRLAVESYGRAFRVVVEYKNRLEELSIISWCWRHQAIQRDAEEALAEAFVPLSEAIEAAT